MISTYKLKFFGKVKRVSFRETFLNLAIKNKINGFVKNEKNYIIVFIQQEEKILKIFLNKIKEKLQNENKLIYIENILIEKIKNKKLFKKFEIKYLNFLNKFFSKSHNFLRKNNNIKNYENLYRNEKIPNHIVIIPDGNRRHSKKIK